MRLDVGHPVWLKASVDVLLLVGHGDARDFRVARRQRCRLCNYHSQGTNDATREFFDTAHFLIPPLINPRPAATANQFLMQIIP